MSVLVLPARGSGKSRDFPIGHERVAMACRPVRWTTATVDRWTRAPTWRRPSPRATAGTTGRNPPYTPHRSRSRRRNWRSPARSTKRGCAL